MSLAQNVETKLWTMMKKRSQGIRCWQHKCYVATDMLSTVFFAFGTQSNASHSQVNVSLPESQDVYGKMYVHADARAWKTCTQTAIRTELKYKDQCNWSYFYTPKGQC